MKFKLCCNVYIINHFNHYLARYKRKNKILIQENNNNNRKMDNRKSTYGHFGFGGSLRTPKTTNSGRPSLFSQSGRRPQQDFSRPSMATGRVSLTSDARYSFVGGASIGGGARISTFPGMAGRQSLAVPKILNQAEQRNIRDKQIQYDMVEKVVNFLADCYNPQPSFKFDDHNFLRIPNRNDFKNVFEFLMQNIQPSFQMVKLDDERLLKIVNNLGYPYPFKPNTLKTMTGRDWPTMLSVLDWLVDVILMDNNVHAKNRIGDVAKWHLLVSCYKRNLGFRGNNVTAANQRPDVALFDEEFEAYKQAKLGEDEHDDAFGERRLRRVACETKIKEVEADILEEKEQIATIEGSITDMEADIASLKKYNADLVIKTSQIEQLLLQATEIHGSLGRQIATLNAENAGKDRQIAAQKISGSEARQLLTERQSIREEITMMRERTGQTENKIFKLQPDHYKISAQIRSDYAALVSCLKGLCESLCNFNDAQNLIASLDRENFEQIVNDIEKTDINENKLSQLIGHLKELCERKMLAYKQNEQEVGQHIVDLQKAIRELQSSKEQLKTKQELEIERAMRERDDNMCPETDHKHNLELVKQKRKTTSDALAKHTAHLNELHEKLAEKYKQYIDYKRQLDSNYNDLQSAVLEKINKICDRFQQIQDEKKRFKELAEQMLYENKETAKIKGKGAKKTKQ